MNFLSPPRVIPLLILCFLSSSIGAVRRGINSDHVIGIVHEVTRKTIYDIRDLSQLDGLDFEDYKMVANLSTEKERDYCKKRHDQEKKSREEEEKLLLKKAKESGFKKGVFHSLIATGIIFLVQQKHISVGTLLKIGAAGYGVYALIEFGRYLHGYLEENNKKNRSITRLNEIVIRSMIKEEQKV